MIAIGVYECISTFSPLVQYPSNHCLSPYSSKQRLNYSLYYRSTEYQIERNREIERKRGRDRLLDAFILLCDLTQINQIALQNTWTWHYCTSAHLRMCTAWYAYWPWEFATEQMVRCLSTCFHFIPFIVTHCHKIEFDSIKSHHG